LASFVSESRAKDRISTWRRTHFDDLRSNTAIHLLIETGIRVGELVAIDRSDLSMTDACIVIHGKGNRQRLAYLPQQPLRRKLTHCLGQRGDVIASNDRLFVASDGRPLSASAVRRELRRISVRAGISRRVTRVHHRRR